MQKAIIILIIIVSLHSITLYSQQSDISSSSVFLLTLNKDENYKLSIYKYENNFFFKKDSSNIRYIDRNPLILYNRYLVDFQGQVYDIKNKEYIFEINQDEFNLIGIKNNLIYYYCNSCRDVFVTNTENATINISNCYFAFDIITSVLDAVNKISEHPYLYNKVGHIYLHNSILKIIYYRGIILSLGKKFKARAFNTDDNIIPFLWLSKNTFLTQVSNGVIVKSDTIGNIDTIVAFPKITKHKGRANLYRDSNNMIVYEFFKSKPIFEYKYSKRYSIDVENKTFKKYKPFFKKGDYNYSIDKDICYYYFNNELLFKEEYKIENNNNVKIFNNFIAVLVGNKKHKQIKIWNSKKKKWYYINNLPENTSIIGWIEK